MKTVSDTISACEVRRFVDGSTEMITVELLKVINLEAWGDVAGCVKNVRWEASSCMMCLVKFRFMWIYYYLFTKCEHFLKIYDWLAI